MSRATMRGWRRCGRRCASSRRELPVLAFPAWDCLPYDRISPNSEIAGGADGDARRAGGRVRPAGGGADHGERRDPAGAGAGGPGGGELHRARSASGSMWRRLRGYLARMGFQQAPTVTEPGEFAVRGGLIDIYPAGRAAGRCGSTSSATCSTARGASIPRPSAPPRRSARVELAPVSEVILDEAGDPAVPHAATASISAPAGSDDPLYEAISAGRKHQGYEHWLPFFHERLETLFDYLPGAPVLLDDQIGRGAGGALGGARRRSTRRGRRRSAAKSRLGTVYKPVPPGELYLDDAAWEAALAGRPLHQLVGAAAAAGAGGDRRRRADRAGLRARAAAGGAQPLRRAGRACRGAAPGGRRGDRELFRGRARAAGGPARRQRRHRRARDRAGPRTSRRRTAGSISRSGRSSTGSRRRG